ncbi:hypothetical protein ES332_A12G236400v1 [Gossypium tomentosum]|uniref:CS domain-containing protein n=1 Tax=Gossypium tomentosum TaxID=34277 RepID=A0A5D2N129_GOSTO|nr:hypothetical protein ES332_A12G236400v1 [Gossypium tomentosum]
MLCLSLQNPTKTLHFSIKTHSFHFLKPHLPAFRRYSGGVTPISPLRGFSCNCSSTNTTHYEFSDGSSEVELRLQLGGQDVLSAKDIFVDADGTSLTVKIQQAGSIITLIDTNSLFEKIKPAETIWYTPLVTKELLETFAKQTVDSWVLAKGSDSVAEAESAILESLSCHVRAVVATLGGSHGAAGRTDKWRHLYSGFSIWLSQTEATVTVQMRIQQRRKREGTLKMVMLATRMQMWL